MFSAELPADCLRKRLEQILEQKPNLSLEIKKSVKILNKTKNKNRIERLKSKKASEKLLSDNIEKMGDNLIKDIVNYVPTHTNRGPNISKMLLPFFEPKGFYNFDILHNNKIAVIHHLPNEMMGISIFSNCGLLQKRVQFDFTSQHSMSIKTVNSSIIFDHSKAVYAPKNNVLEFHLSIMNTNLKIHRTVKLEKMIYSIYANEYEIFCYSSDNKINVFNYRLDNYRILGQSTTPRLAYYFDPSYSQQIVQIAYRKEVFFCLYDYKLDAISEMDGLVRKSLQINATNFAIDNKGNILFLLNCGQKLVKYNSQFDLLEETVVHDLRKATSVRISGDNKIVLSYEHQDFSYEIDF